MFPLHHPECEVILYDYMQAMCWWIYLYYIYYHALQSCVCIVPLYYSECTKGLYTDDTVYIKIMGDIKNDGLLYYHSAGEWQKTTNPGWYPGLPPELVALTLLWSNFAK